MEDKQNHTHGNLIDRCCSLAVTSNKGPHDPSIAPHPTGVGRRVEKETQKLMGLEKGSLTETANEVNSNNSNTDKKNIQNKQRNGQSNPHRPMPHALPSCY